MAEPRPPAPPRPLARRALGVAASLLVCSAPPAAVAATDEGQGTPWTLPARVVAVGLPDVRGVREVGRFHGGGPIPGNPEFLMHTHAGRVLDPTRVLVAVGSNLGAPAADGRQAPGTVLSIDTTQPQTLRVAADLAAPGRADTRGRGAVQVYSAHAAPYLNRRHNPRAATAHLSAVAGPTYLSINNAFGRPWIANAPAGADGAGTVSVVDPDGAPLAHAPSTAAGGVFAGHATPRTTVPRSARSGVLAGWFNHRPSAQLTAGALAAGALGTAFLGPSPDGSGRAVFAVATADGAVAQVHVQDGVDGLAPPGTLGAADPDARLVGMAFQWTPERVLFVADAARHRIVVLHLRDDGRHLLIERRTALTSPALRQPVDLAPAVPEVANPRFSSHTTLAGDSDLYVANRGDGTLLRIDRRGRVIARAMIVLGQGATVGAGRIRAIAVSADAQRLWLTLQGPMPGQADPDGALIEVTGFDAAGPFGRPRPPGVSANAPAAPADARSGRGAQLFQRQFTATEGLGARFNARSCAACHFMPTVGGMSTVEAHFVRRVARMDPVSGRVWPLGAAHGAVAHRHAADTAAPLALPRAANVVSLRMPPALPPVARIDEIDDAAIEAQAVAKGDGIHGRVHRVIGPDGQPRIGRYGWKADIATLEQMVAEAFASELGMPGGPSLPTAAGASGDASAIQAVTHFLRQLTPAGGP